MYPTIFGDVASQQQVGREFLGHGAIVVESRALWNWSLLEFFAISMRKSQSPLIGKLAGKNLQNFCEPGACIRVNTIRFSIQIVFNRVIRHPWFSRLSPLRFRHIQIEEPGLYERATRLRP
jgi:hypothetical protein